VRRRVVLCACYAAWAVAAARAGADEAVPGANSLARCTAITAAAERLACYDALVARPTVAPGAAAETAAAPPERQNFGLTPAQRPAPARVEAITARVVSVGRSANGRPFVRLDNDQWWELDGDDARLAAGNEVQIRHGALTSYLMIIAGHPTHHVRRLR
jgi:hypothetical protein